MNLRAIRQAKGLRLTDLADMIGTDVSTVSRAENMHKSAMLATYIKCAEALGVTLADLFSDDRTALEQSLISAFRRVPTDKHAMLFDLLKLAEAQPPKATPPAPPVDPQSKP